MTEARQDPVGRLRRLWDEGRWPDLAEFLAATGPLPPLELAAVLREDQRQRWHVGQRLAAEHYLDAYPAVAADEEAALDVIYAEYLLRKGRGEAANLDEFLRRFPRFAEQIRLQLDFGEALEERQAAPHPNSPTPGADAGPLPTERWAPSAPVELRHGGQPAGSPAEEAVRTVPRGADIGGLPADTKSRIEEICNRFEAAWVKGRSPRVEDYLVQAAAEERPALLRELLPLEAGYRRAHGEAPTTDEYRSRFPALDPRWLEKAVADSAGAPTRTPGAEQPFRRPRAHRIRCPHCHSPIQLIDERPREVLCPGCGSSFRMQEAKGTSSPASMRLGKFQLLERVGHGAFGAVWRALDVELERVVALKIPHAGLSISSTELRHFIDEARKAAKLRHQGVVTVHEVTTLQGLPVIVSDFIHGVTLKDLLEARRPTFAETARLIAEVADALHYAHDQGLTHRDVKPANIMVERGQRAADGPGGDHLGRPLVLDFGLALREEAEVTMTLDGEIIGTPAYINPEQAAGRGRHADRRSDVFSLGVVLYEMLTGELPFRGSRLMLLDQVQHDDPRPPRRINERIPRDLETICLKAMAKLPARRYQTAAELAEDLRRFLRGDPVHARRAGRAERVWRWCRRRPRDAALAAAVLGLLLLLAVGSTVAAILIERERSRAETHLTETLDALDSLSAAAEKVTDDAPQMEDEQYELLEKALALRKKILEEEPSAVSRVKLALAYHQMGRILKNLGDAERAREDFTRAIAEFAALAASGDPDARNDEAVNHNDLAEVLRATHPPDAPAHYEKALAIQEDLKACCPNREVFLQELARTCNNYGIFLAHRGDPDSRSRAKDKYDEAIGLLRPLADDSRPEFQADLARALINHGELLGSTNQAVQEYEEAIGLLGKLQAKRPGKHDYWFRLGVANENKGAALADQKKFKDAETADRAALDQFTRLADEFPQTPLYRKDLANTWNNLGTALWNDNAGARAREPWQKARGFFEQLVIDHSDVLEYKSKAATNLQNLGLIDLLIDGKPAEAQPLLAKAIDLETEAWEKSNRQNLEYLRLLCGHRYVHAHSLADQGAYAEAAAEAETLIVQAAGDAETSNVNTLNAAGILSLCVPLAEADSKVGEPKRQELVRGYAGHALELLRDVSAKGLKWTVYDGDPDFNPVRAREDFRRLSDEWKRRENGPS